MKSSTNQLGFVTTVSPRLRTVKGQRITRPTPYVCYVADHVAKLGGKILVCAPEDFHWSGQTVRAWSPVHAHDAFGKWERSVHRLPGVIYENVFVHLSMKGETKTLRTHAKERNIPLFNPFLPNKYQLHDWLHQTEVGGYFPPTERLRNAKQVENRVKEWKTLYVKPIGGYGGMGVTRVEALTGGAYRLSLDRQKEGKTGARRLKLTSSQLRAAIKQRLDVAHIVQRGLNLLTVQGRKVDFRVVVQRNAGGEWKLVGIVPKMAAADGVVTNLIAGGKSLTIEQCIARAKSEGKQIPISDLEQCAIEISRKISIRYPTTALLGYDIGLDERGGTWIIEMNPKPARSLLTSDMRRLSARYTAEFAMYLATR